MLSIGLVFLILALIMFVLAGFGVPAAVSWRDLGFAFVVAWVIAGTLG